MNVPYVLCQHLYYVPLYNATRRNETHNHPPNANSMRLTTMLEGLTSANAVTGGIRDNRGAYAVTGGIRASGAYEVLTSANES